MKKYNYTYQTKNLINGKTYIGVHSTNNLNDGYMGSGLRLKQAINKYGKENFITTILSYFDTKEEAYEEEAWLVDEKWVKMQNNYNFAIGGSGGFLGYDVTNKISTKFIKGQSPWNKGNKTYIRTYQSKGRDNQKKVMSDLMKGENNPMFGKTGEQSNTFKNKSNDLPVYITLRKVIKNPFEVRVKGKYVGVSSTLEEAIILKEEYLIKLNKN